MKKTLLTAAAVLISASAFAQTVTSANIVGYNKKAIAADQFLILAPQFSTTNSVTLDDAFSGVSTSDKVYIWDGTSYSKYEYFGGDYGWLDDVYSPANDTEINLGQSVWYAPSVATNLLMSGEVPADSSLTVELIAGTLNMIANPYPVELALDDIPVESISTGDIVYVWDGTTYSKYEYFGGDYGWLDDVYSPAGNIKIPVGDGFWMQSANGGIIVFDKQF